MKKVIIAGVLFSLILLVGCNREPEVVVLEASENDADLSPASNLLSELKYEIITSITKQTEIDRESIGIMVGGSPVNGIIDVSVNLPKDVKVVDTMIQQIVEDSIKKVSKVENVTIHEENITIKIEKY